MNLVTTMTTVEKDVEAVSIESFSGVVELSRQGVGRSIIHRENHAAPRIFICGKKYRSELVCALSTSRSILPIANIECFLECSFDYLKLFYKSRQSISRSVRHLKES